MDRKQFDRLSRLVAAGSRRDALRVLIGAAATGALLSSDAEARKRQRGERRQKKKVRSQQALGCPSTCNQNCINKPIHPGVNLTRCNLNERDLDGVNLSSSNLTQACFGDSSLRSARFSGANVSGVCFCGADLTGADFRGTKVTAGQLACATVGCNTILPNGKPAVPCAKGKTCCNGLCINIRTDPGNCGACGKQCAACQTCDNGRCKNLPDFQFDCKGDPLKHLGSGAVCTTEQGTGICDGGFCNCGPGGVYDVDANVCLCNQGENDSCREDANRCCYVSATCLENGQFSTESHCTECGLGGSPGIGITLCCQYLCSETGGLGQYKYICMENAHPPQTVCDQSFSGCPLSRSLYQTSGCHRCPIVV